MTYKDGLVDVLGGKMDGVFVMLVLLNIQKACVQSFLFDGASI